MAYDFVAALWLCERDGAILGVRPWYGGGAFFLPGGLLEPGETWAQAAAREAYEEAGLPVDVAALTEVARLEHPAYGRPGSTVLLACYTGGDPGGTPHPDGVEIDEVAWLAPADHGRFTPGVRALLDLISDRGADPAAGR